MHGDTPAIMPAKNPMKSKPTIGLSYVPQSRSDVTVASD